MSENNPSQVPYVSHHLGNTLRPDENTGEFDLDALLADSIQAKQDAKVLKKETKRLKESLEKTQRSREMAADNLRSAKYQFEREWEPVAAVAMFHTQRCVACGTNHTHFTGVFQHQIKRNGGVTGTMKIEQWVRATDHTMIEGLPKVQKETDEPVDMCVCCATQLGYAAKLYA